MSRYLLKIITCIAVAIVFANLCCDDSNENSGSTGSPFAELEEQGALRYMGVASVASKSTKGDITTYTFDPSSGPMCLHGGTFNTNVRDIGSEDLLIYLQGGGACWSEYCMSLTEALTELPDDLDILSLQHPTNPFREWNLVYVPYCDGSFFMGDADRDDDGDGTADRFNRGLRNLSAAMDVTAQNFPNPRRVFLAGSSAGGYGTIAATILVRAMYPNAEILTFADAGIGIFRPEEPLFLSGFLEDINATAWIPKSCPDCLAKGHLTPLIEYELEHDPNLKAAAFMTYGDMVISSTFLELTAEEHRALLIQETTRIHDRFPSRYAQFLVEGTFHTTLTGGISETLTEEMAQMAALVDVGGIDTTTLEGITVADWITAMLEGSSTWKPMIQ